MTAQPPDPEEPTDLDPDGTDLRALDDDGTDPAEPTRLNGLDLQPPIRQLDAPSGPPGGRIFTLEGRPVPAVYLIAWLASVGGAAALLAATQAVPSPGRSAMALAGMLGLGVGLAAAVSYQLVARADRYPDRYRGPSPLLLFGLVLVLSTLASAALGIVGLVDPDRPVGFLIGLVVVALAYVVAIWIFVVRSGALTWTDMGWPRAGGGLVRRALIPIGVATLVMIPATFGVLIWGGLLAQVLDVRAPETLPQASNAMEALAVTLAAAVVAPIGEEVFFRGFALTAWLRDLGERAALIRSALFFAVVHILNIRVEADQAGQGIAQALLQFAVILPLGLVLGWLFLRRGVLAAIAGHVTYNGILLMLLALRPLLPAGT